MNLRRNKRLLGLLISAALLASTTAPVFALEQDVRMGPGGFLADSQRKAASDQLGQIIRDITVARTDLNQTHPTAAKEALQQAQTALKGFRERYGNGTASVFISAKHKRPGTSPLDVVGESFMKSLRQLDDAKSALTQGRFETAAQIVESIDYPLVFAAIDIPLAQTQNRIDTALTLLKAGKTASAQQPLEMTQDSAATDSGMFAGNFGAG